MDVKEFVGGNSVTIDYVKDSPSKRLVLLSEGAVKEYEGRKRVVFFVEIDGKQISYIPNKTTLLNLAGAWGMDTKNWLAKVVSLSIERINNREAVIGRPQ